jgi:hypothetical protein
MTEGWRKVLHSLCSLLDVTGARGSVVVKILLRGWLYFMETECASCEVRTGL